MAEVFAGRYVPREWGAPISLDPWFVTGFAEGEGAFTCVSTAGRVMPIFAIRQRADYGDALYRIRSFFGVGKIYQCRARPPTQASCYYRVCKWEELQTVIDHFDAYPLLSERKRAAFNAWKHLIRVRGWRGRGGTAAEIEAAAQGLSALNTRPRFGCRRRNSVVNAISH
jgi:hypothetical protein